MIVLSDITHYHNTPSGPNILFAGLNVRFRPRERVGILAAQGAGKSSLARILSGIETPDKGTMKHGGRISWPIGFAGWLHIDVTGAENVANIARLMGESPLDTIAFCRAFSGLGDDMNRPVGIYSPATRAKLGFALSMAIRRDYYIADETIGVGDGAFRDRSAAMLHRRLEDAGLVFLSRNHIQLEKFCNRFLVLVNSQLIEVDSAKKAGEILKQDQVQLIKEDII